MKYHASANLQEVFKETEGDRDGEQMFVFYLSSFLPCKKSNNSPFKNMRLFKSILYLIDDIVDRGQSEDEGWKEFMKTLLLHV